MDPECAKLASPVTMHPVPYFPQLSDDPATRYAAFVTTISIFECASINTVVLLNVNVEFLTTSFHEIPLLSGCDGRNGSERQLRR